MLKLLHGDPDLFANLATQRREQSRALTESYAAATLRQRAEQAWTAKDYAGVVAAYHALDELSTACLAESEHRRARYAQKQLDC